MHKQIQNVGKFPAVPAKDVKLGMTLILDDGEIMKVVGVANVRRVWYEIILENKKERRLINKRYGTLLGVYDDRTNL